MYQLVHRFAPTSARLRAVLAALLSTVAVLGAAGTTIAGSIAAATFAVLVTVATAAVAVALGYGLVNQAEAAPEEANPAWQPSTTESEADADPIATLQQRYAEGELTDEEFERRMERLLDSGERSSTGRDAAGRNERERELER